MFNAAVVEFCLPFGGQDDPVAQLKLGVPKIE